MRIVTLSVFAALVGCHHERRADPPPSSGVYARLEARLPVALEALGRLRESLRAAGEDCGQVARSLRTFAHAHHATFIEINELFDKLDARERERFQYDHHEDRVQLTDLFGMLRTCPADVDVTRAFVLAGFRDRRWTD